MFIQAICAGCLALAIGIALYHAILAAVALLRPRADRPTIFVQAPRYRFAIVIPAHNEEQTLSLTLESCYALVYPRESYDVFVVADNCTDRTGAIARQMGANCLERHDREQRGKGHALAWAFERLLGEGHDAVVVLDADCTLDSHALRVFAAYLDAGEQVLQAKVTVSNPDDNSISLALAIGNLLENDLFYAPKDRLGGAVYLRGTGMVFRRELLERIQFRAQTKVEDKEYTLRLLREGIAVRFVSEVSLQTPFPASPEQLQVQRERWTAGSIHFSKRMALRLILEGLAHGKFRIADAGWTLLVEMRALVVLQLLLTIGLALVCRYSTPGLLADSLLAAGAAVALLHGVCWGLGVLCLGITRRRLVLLCTIGLPFAQLMAIFLRCVFGRRSPHWQKTPRTPTPPGMATVERAAVRLPGAGARTSHVAPPDTKHRQTIG